MTRTRTRLTVLTAIVVVALSGGAAGAGEADVVGAIAQRAGDSWRFDVTVRHADTGWDHYADRWDVLAPDGTVLARRTLYHPHVDEQPFTRSLDNVHIPADVSTVTIRAHDKVHGLGGSEFTLTLPKAGSPGSGS